MKNMGNKFNKEKTYIFSKERYIEMSGIITESNDGEWYDRIDGLEVEMICGDTAKCWDMLVIPEWCEEVDTEPKIILEVSQKDLNLIIKSLDYLNNNNYFIGESESELAEKLIKKFNKKSK